MVAGISACGLAACGADDPQPGPVGGGSGSGGSPAAMGGTNPQAGMGGSPASSGSGGSAPAAGTGGGGASAGGTGGAAAGAGGSGGAAAGSGGSAGGGGGTTDCKGHALSLDSNVPAGNDPAKAHVEVDFGASADLPIGAAARTVEFWAYVLMSSWAGEDNTIFEYGDQATANAGFGLDFGGEPGTIDPYTNGSFDNDNQASGLTEDMDRWVHFAMTWDGTAVRTYVNGVVKSTKMVGGAMLATSKTALWIGGNPRNSYFNGNLDEFRVWNVARSEADIAGSMGKTLVGNEAGLVGYWQFNETMGTEAADSANGAGHMKHPGVLKADTAEHLPKFVVSTAPVSCP